MGLQSAVVERIGGRNEGEGEGEVLELAAML